MSILNEHGRLARFLRNVRHDARAPGARPVMTPDQMEELGQHLVHMTPTDSVQVVIRQTAMTNIRMSQGFAQSSEDGGKIEIAIFTEFGARAAVVYTNQVDEHALRSLVDWSDMIARMPTQSLSLLQGTQREFQDTYLPVALWHESTVQAMTTARTSLLSEMIGPVAQRGLRAGGFIGLMARAEGQFSTDKIKAYYEETDCEITVSARTTDGTGAGWAGQAARDYAQLVPDTLTAQAIDLAVRGTNPKAVEPGHWTVILTREAVAQIFRFFAGFFSFDGTVVTHNTPMWKPAFPWTRIGEHIFDSRINMEANPADPEGGFAPFWQSGGGLGFANPRIKLVENGVLKILAASPSLAVSKGWPYSQVPAGLRVSGGTTSIEEMIASCPLGIYVNRFSDVELLEGRSGVMTGLTRDGCFLVKDGKMAMPVKNFRFVDSPMFMLNKLLALGESKRAAYGYTPRSIGEDEVELTEWPRRPIIVPPMMVRDFNFTSLSDAV